MTPTSGFEPSCAHREDDMLLCLVLADGAYQEQVREKLRAGLRERLETAGAEPPPLNFEFVEAIDRDRRTMSKLKFSVGGSAGLWRFLKRGLRASEAVTRDACSGRRSTAGGRPTEMPASR